MFCFFLFCFEVTHTTDAAGRDIISAGLAEMMNARHLIHPAPCIHRYQSRIPKGTFLRRAFYLLSDYAVSLYAKANSNRPIVING